MKRKFIIIIVLALLPVAVNSQIVRVFDTWSSILENKGDTIYNVTFDRSSRARDTWNIVYIKKDKELKKRIKEKTIAISYNNILLLNPSYVERRLVNLSGSLVGKGFLQMYATPKMMYFVAIPSDYAAFGGFGMVGGVLGALLTYDYESNGSAYYYIIDFHNKKATKVDKYEMKELLKSYPDMLASFNQTKKNKNLRVVNHYFREYVKTINSDTVYNFAPYKELPEKK